ncbi:PhoX family phosphatase [Gordonia sp. HY002]|uniref:PhoX family protein n=1 Tax=Gordonia zhenghanii TaxID=2911516 RepID=UPI001EF0DECF|nr:PhoX family phosphatase [Gordonia zhenghanii]MCF8571660.1 PhoX family phosphatase [Gordonia zhenghanii]MCF8602683.1 PhoX family phosphatase [Gordonia zhenghanii]
MRIPLQLFTIGGDGVGRSARARVTCRYKCGEACWHEPGNTSDNEYFRDVARTALSRRTVLRGSAGAVLAVGATSLLAACGDDGATSSGAPSTGSGSGPVDGMKFDIVTPNTDDALRVPNGYDQKVVIRWGDPVVPGAPEFDFENQTADAQSKQFGFNNDFAGLIPIAGHDGSFYLVVNQEYTSEEFMFHGYKEKEPTEEQARISMAAHGITVLEVKASGKDGSLTPVVGPRNRRITASTPFRLTGPAAGTDFVKTTADRAGNAIAGTIANCSGGITPWGTMLSGEENYNNYFSNTSKVTDKAAAAHLKRYGFEDDADYHQWGKFETRFDLAKDPNEANRFGYVVEVDPTDPNGTPLKHSALGRLKHESATIHVVKDGPNAGAVVAYTGDDEKFEYIYKFVSSRKIKEGDTRHNMGILTEGTLYVASFSSDKPVTTDDAAGSGTWHKLMTVAADGSAQSHIKGMTAAEVAVFTREAADKAGATKMDRPEDIEPHPVTGKVYCALTNNDDRGVDGEEGPTAANPRNENKSGQILEMTDDHAGESFTWDLLLVAGDPKAADTYYGGFDKEKVSPISCPDNVAFDPHGNLWISTDGNALKSNDGLFAVALEGERRGETKQFLTVPRGAETCGPIIDEKRVIVCVQHPGEEDDYSADRPFSHWPDGGNAQPRPSVVAVWRKGGGAVGM